MTEITRAYEFVVFLADETTPAFTFTDNDFAAVPTYGGWRVNPLEGTSESEPFTVSIVDTGEQVSDALRDADGRGLLIGRLWRLRINEDGGGLTTVAQGRITGVMLGSDVASYDFECGDERFLTRQRPVYATVAQTAALATPTTQIWPPGLRSKWLDGPTAVVATPAQWANVVQVKTNEILVDLPELGPKVSRAVINWIQSDLKDNQVPGSTGSAPGTGTSFGPT